MNYKVIQTEFDSNKVDPDLHKQREKAVLDGSIKCFIMLEGLRPADGDQDLNLWASEMEDVVLEIFPQGQLHQWYVQLPQVDVHLSIPGIYLHELSMYQYILVQNSGIMICSQMFHICTCMYQYKRI
jgi:hypothetical protein